MVPEGGMIRPPAIGEEFAGARNCYRQARKRQLIPFNRLNKAINQPPGILIAYHGNEIPHSRNRYR